MTMRHHSWYSAELLEVSLLIFLLLKLSASFTYLKEWILGQIQLLPHWSSSWLPKEGIYMDSLVGVGYLFH